MKILSLQKDKDSMSEALKLKTDKEMCKVVHGNLDNNIEDIKTGQETISKKIGDLYNFLLGASKGE